MYFTDTPELRRFEREMRQKPNFDKRNADCDENNQAHNAKHEYPEEINLLLLFDHNPHFTDYQLYDLLSKLSQNLGHAGRS